MQVKSIRIRPELRAAQVERANSMTPALTLYFDEKYDLGSTYLPESFRKVSLLQCLWLLIRTSAKVLEVPEPLWLRFFPKNLLLLSTWKIAGLLRRRRQVAVTYAIENNDLRNLLSPNKSIPSVALRVPAYIFGFVIRIFIDRIAFGSAGSRHLYHSLPGVDKIPHSLHEELPARSVESGTQDNARVVFIGELDNRKGILDLMAAWPTVETKIPYAVLTIIGGGEHMQEVAQWCSKRPSARVFLGFLPHDEVKKSLMGAGVLVAPSRRSGRWREQIGLPIGEALARGLTVVTTDETGLAKWLSANGHVVIDENSAAQRLGAAIISAVESQLSVSAVQDSLPHIPGRIAADKWLHTQ